MIGTANSAFQQDIEKWFAPMDFVGINYYNSARTQSGYRYRFGLTWVDRAAGRRRWKKSRHYFSKVCKTRLVD